MTNNSTTPALWFMNSRVRIVSGASDNSDGLSVIKHWLPFGESPPLHIHDSEDEVFHIIEGNVRFIVGDEIIEKTAGDSLVAPKGVPHTFVVDSADGAKLVTVTAHGDFEAMIHEVSRPATDAGLPEPSGPPTPEMAAALTEICARHAIRFVGAPLEPRQAAA